MVETLHVVLWIVLPLLLLISLAALILVIYGLTSGTVGPKGPAGATGSAGPIGATGPVGPIGQYFNIITVGLGQIISISAPNGLNGIVYYIVNDVDNSTLIVGIEPNITVGQSFYIYNIGNFFITKVIQASGITITGLPENIPPNTRLRFDVTSNKTATVTVV